MTGFLSCFLEIALAEPAKCRATTGCGRSELAADAAVLRLTEAWRRAHPLEALREFGAGAPPDVAVAPGAAPLSWRWLASGERSRRVAEVYKLL